MNIHRHSNETSESTGKTRPLIIGGVSEMYVGQQLKEFRQSGIEWLVVVMNFTSIHEYLEKWQVIFIHYVDEVC